MYLSNKNIKLIFLNPMDNLSGYGSIWDWSYLDGVYLDFDNSFPINEIVHMSNKRDCPIGQAHLDMDIPIDIPIDGSIFTTLFFTRQDDDVFFCIAF